MKNEKLIFLGSGLLLIVLLIASFANKSVQQTASEPPEPQKIEISVKSEPSTLGGFGTVSISQSLLGANTTTAGVVQLNTTTDPLYTRPIKTGGNQDNLTLGIFAKSSTSAPQLNLSPEVSFDCKNYYGLATLFDNSSTTKILNQVTTTFTVLLPAASNVASSTIAHQFADLNADCVRYKVARGTGDGLGNMILYMSSYVDSDF